MEKRKISETLNLLFTSQTWLDSAVATDWDSLSAITFSFPPKSTPWSDGSIFWNFL